MKSVSTTLLQLNQFESRNSSVSGRFTLADKARRLLYLLRITSGWERENFELIVFCCWENEQSGQSDALAVANQLSSSSRLRTLEKRQEPQEYCVLLKKEKWLVSPRKSIFKFAIHWIVSNA